MPHMEWQESYSVHLPVFDGEHKQLFNLYNEFYDAFVSNHGHDVLVPMLEKVCQYAVKHFHSEEVWMEKHHYPGLAAHRDEHQKFTAQAVGLLEDCKHGRLVLSSKVGHMLEEWLNHHIMGTDKKYGEFAVSKSIH